MPSNEQIEETIEKLRARSELNVQLEQNLFEKAVDIGYWRSFQPGMKVLNLQSVDQLESAPFSSEQETWALAHLAKHGYFRMPPLIDSAVIARLCTSVEALRHAGWPAIFSYVYDEFWAVLRTPSIVRLLSRRLGTGYLQASGVWTYRVDPRHRGSGWPPHVDSRDERLSVWIPLTDATVENGCMYVIPQDRVPPTLPTSYLDWTSISIHEFETLLHDVIPLPAAHGSVLGWNNSLIHWGGRATELANHPRISIAAEFLPEGTRPDCSDLPVFDAELPNFRARLRVIGEAILAYERFELGMRRYRGLAKRLVGWGSKQ
jgi:Phytanoyl-CoA dioxygenase (PhyH)